MDYANVASKRNVQLVAEKVVELDEKIDRIALAIFAKLDVIEKKIAETEKVTQKKEQVKKAV